MNNDSTSVRQLKTATAFLSTLILVTIAYQGFYRFGFGADTMTHDLNPLINIESKLPYARYIAYFVEISCYKMGVILPQHYKLFYVLFVMVTAVTAFRYQQIMIRLLEKKEIRLSLVEEYFGRAILSLPFISTLYSEYFMFPECFVFCLGFMFSSIALLFYSRKKPVLAALLLLLAVFTYQVTVMVSAVYALLYIVVDEDFVMTFKMFRRGLIISLCCVLAGGVNFVVSRIFFYLGIITDVPKQISVGSVLYRIGHALGIIKAFLISGNGLIPLPGANLLVVILAVILMTICCKEKKGAVLTLVFSGIIMFCLAIVIPLIQSDAPRVIFVLYAALGCTLFLSYVQLNGKAMAVMQMVITGTMFLQIFSCQQIAVNHYISNTQDLECARAVLDAIDNYEKETGNTVKEIAVCEDSVCYNYYENVYYTLGQINERVARVVPYSLLEYVNKKDTGTDERRFKKSKQSSGKVRKKYFEGKEWDSFNVYEQLVIDGDTAYWCIY